MTRTLTITYDKSNEDKPVLCVAESGSSIFPTSFVIKKIFTGKKAEQLYNELTGQNEIVKPESEEEKMNGAEIYQKMGELSIKYANKGLTIDFEFNRFGMILRGYLDMSLNTVNIYSYNRLYSYEFMQHMSDTLDIEMLVDNFKEEVFEHYRMEKMKGVEGEE